MDNFLKQFPINTQIVVAWGEMDALQHVNNVVYFRYFETARIDFFNQINLLTLKTIVFCFTEPPFCLSRPKHKFAFHWRH